MPCGREKINWTSGTFGAARHHRHHFTAPTMKRYRNEMDSSFSTFCAGELFSIPPLCPTTPLFSTSRCSCPLLSSAFLFWFSCAFISRYIFWLNALSLNFGYHAIMPSLPANKHFVPSLIAPSDAFCIFFFHSIHKNGDPTSNGWVELVNIFIKMWKSKIELHIDDGAAAMLCIAHTSTLAVFKVLKNFVFRLPRFLWVFFFCLSLKNVIKLIIQ